MGERKEKEEDIDELILKLLEKKKAVRRALVLEDNMVSEKKMTSSNTIDMEVSKEEKVQSSGSNKSPSFVEVVGKSKAPLMPNAHKERGKMISRTQSKMGFKSEGDNVIPRKKEVQKGGWVGDQRRSARWVEQHDGRRYTIGRNYHMPIGRGGSNGGKGSQRINAASSMVGSINFQNKKWIYEGGSNRVNSVSKKQRGNSKKQ